MNKHLIHTVVYHQASIHPERIAVAEAEKEYTYRQLKDESQVLGRLIRKLGDGKPAPVAVLLPPGFQLIKSLLGIFQSGQIYLPVDPQFHPKRIRAIIDQSRPSICITQRALVPLLRQVLYDGNPYSCLILVAEDLAALPDYPERVADPAPEDPNYIFYTSGSTGEAKAILGCHDSLSHFIHWEVKEFDLDKDCRVSQLSQFTFDASLRDIFVPLACGGTVVVPPAGIKNNIPLLVEWLDRQGVTLIHGVPSLFRLITRELQSRGAGRQLRRCKHFLLAGEPLFGKDVAAWKSTGASHVELVNLYGTSETTMAKSFHRIKETPRDPAQVIHAGKPISNSLIAVIQNGRLCKPGEIGEIYIITPFMTLGYYRNPALTDTVFVQNPLVKDRKELVYRTGDFGIYLDDGNVEVLGRKDDQVKVNGIRVEPGEVKQAVLRCAGVVDAEVVTFKKSPEENELACYYIAATDLEDSLREFLPTEINPALVPTAFLQMESFPLTINGKVDKKALPAIGRAVVTGDAYVPAVTLTEKKLEAIWKELLSLDRTGTAVNFFKIGGASLKLIRMVSMIFHEFNVSLTFADVFAHPTIGALGAFIDDAVREGTTVITPLPAKSFYDVTYAQRRLWFYDCINEQKNLYNIVHPLELSGGLQPAVLLKALNALTERHEILRTVFVNVGGEPKQKVLDNSKAAAAFSYHTRDEFLRRWGSCAELVREEQSREFDLSNGPLFTARLCEAEAGRWFLVFNWHHIISDGWSQDVLLSDLLKLYSSEAELKPLRFQYKDYADWANKQLQGERLEELRRYWLGQFEGAGEPATFPYSFDGEKGRTGAGANLDFVFDPQTADGLRSFAADNGVTPFVVLFAGVQLLLRRYSGLDDIVTGSPFSGRSRMDTAEQAGLYVNLLPLRMQLKEDDTLTAVVDRAKVVLNNAARHQDYPVDLLTEQLGRDGGSGRMLLFNVLIQSQNDLDGVLPVPEGLRIRKAAAEAITCKADISFNFQEQGKQLLGSVEYDRGLYDHSRIEALTADLQHLLRELTTGEVTMAGGLLAGKALPGDMDSLSLLSVLQNL
jgi:amino acid adenylation domain-containing protein